MNDYAAWFGAAVRSIGDGADVVGTVSEMSDGYIAVTTSQWSQLQTGSNVELQLRSEFESARVGARFEGEEPSKASSDPGFRDLIFSLTYVQVEVLKSTRVVLPFTPASILFGGVPISCSLVEVDEDYVDAVTDFPLDAHDLTEIEVATSQGGIKLLGVVRFSGEEPGTGRYKSRLDYQAASRVDGIRWSNYWKPKAA